MEPAPLPDPQEAGSLSADYQQLSTQPFHAALGALALRQHGVFHLRDLRSAGVSSSAVYQRARAGELHRIYQAVYSLVPPPLLPREGRWLAAVLACGIHAALSHASAAALHAVRASSATYIDITVPGRNRRRHSGLRVHRSTTLTARDITIVNGIPCTTISRTLLDLAGTLNRRQLERALDQAEAMGAMNLRDLRDQIARNRTCPAAANLQATLNEHYAGSTITWSELEERFLARARAAGLPAPECNELLILPDGEPPLRPDFLWRAHGILLEVDGHRTHGTRQAFERDRRRDQRATAHGLKPLRSTWRQIEHHPEEVIDTVLALIRLCEGVSSSQRAA